MPAVHQACIAQPERPAGPAVWSVHGHLRLPRTEIPDAALSVPGPSASQSLLPRPQPAFRLPPSVPHGQACPSAQKAGPQGEPHTHTPALARSRDAGAPTLCLLHLNTPNLPSPQAASAQTGRCATSLYADPHPRVGTLTCGHPQATRVKEK